MRWCGRRSPRSIAGWKPSCRRRGSPTGSPPVVDADHRRHYGGMKRAVLVPDDRLPDHPAPPPWPARRIVLDGAMLHVRDTAATADGAEPAVYVHGLGGTSQNWTDLAGLLAGRLDAQAVDLPGFGYSDASRRYTIPAFADRLITFLEHEGRGPVHLIGNSLGGAISVRVAAQRPDL